ncbi:MAG: hypothetical protein Q8P46_15030 [Hyphomicrobiales bacterium]|nr:hypothetical protein [Hyphomicrobiales bacterium]
MNDRYEMERERSRRGWRVVDRFTGWPAQVNGAPQIRLSLEDADDLVDLLNLQDARRRKAEA